MEIKKKRETIPDIDCLKSYFEQIKKTPLLSAAEEIELSRRIQKGDNEALNHLVEANLRLVVKIAIEFQMPDIPLLDLIQEGNMGLIKAASRFDFRRKVRFSTYAAWWIKQAIMRALSNKRRTIRIPHRKEEVLRKINRASTLFYQTNMRQPSTEELAREVHLTVQEVENLLRAVNNTVSFDKQNIDDTLTLHEVYEDYSFNPDRQLMKKCLQETTQKYLNRLMDKEREILFYRFAFVTGKRYTLKRIGQKMGLSPETVRQIELRALQKLKRVAGELKAYNTN